jgi:DNA ligase-1
MNIHYRTEVQVRAAAHIFRIKASALALAGILAIWPGSGRAVKRAESEPAPKSSDSSPQTTPSSLEKEPAQGVHLAQWATPWDKRLDARAYALSEKLDGVRAVWDGKNLRFRSGRAIAAPAWFLAALPAQALDGELWMGRGSFDRLSAIVRKTQPEDEDWRAVRYMVFDAPATSKTFRQRYQSAQELVAAAHTHWLVLVVQDSVGAAQELPERLQSVVDQGGEGLVLHHWDALWQPGRSNAVRKLKPHADEEGRVLALIAGKGQFEGQMGALFLETPDKKRFTLGTGFSQADRRAPPPVGSWVTYRYRDRTPQGIPRFASFLRVRGEE